MYSHVLSTGIVVLTKNSNVRGVKDDDRIAVSPEAKTSNPPLPSLTATPSMLNSVPSTPAKAPAESVIVSVELTSQS